MTQEDHKLAIILLQILRKENAISDTVAGSATKKINDMCDAYASHTF